MCAAYDGSQVVGARVAAARVLLELVYYGLRDGQVRRLDPPTPIAA